MPMNVRSIADVVILSNFARLMNDPRHVDAARDVRELLDEGHTQFILDLNGLRGLGDAGLGLLTTLTRAIRQRDGEVVLANISEPTRAYLDEMRMDTYWDYFDKLDEAQAYFGGSS